MMTLQVSRLVLVGIMITMTTVCVPGTNADDVDRELANEFEADDNAEDAQYENVDVDDDEEEMVVNRLVEAIQEHTRQRQKRSNVLEPGKFLLTRPTSRRYAQRRRRLIRRRRAG
eukprot:scpid84327/ scgid33651/ 